MRFVVSDSKMNDFVRAANGRVRVFATRKAADRLQDQLNHRRRTRRFRVQLEPPSEQALRDHTAMVSRCLTNVEQKRSKKAKAPLMKGVKPMETLR